MPQVPISVVVDFIGSVALICLLSRAYGTVRRFMPGISLAPQVAGLTFGLVAAAQMFAPIEPFPGLIIDLRNIPIVLAGAFLGLRGLLSCLLVAIGARVGIGGIGLSSGIVAMILVGAVGLAWDALTNQPERRSWRALVGLVVMMPVHLLALLLLPYEMMTWFLTTAAGPLFGAYLIVIPLSGFLLEQERVKMASEARLRAVTRADPEADFPSFERLQTEISQAFAVGRFNRGAAAIQMAFQPGFRHAPFWGEDLKDLVSVSLHNRIAPLVPDGVTFGQVSPGSIVFLAPDHMALSMDGLAAMIRRDIAPESIRLPGSVPSYPCVTVTRLDYDGLPDLEALLSPTSCTTTTAPASARRAPDGTGDTRLFDMAERLIAHHNRLERGRSLEKRDG